MKAYRIVDWDTKYENNRTREVKYMNWVPIPAKLDGDGYTELVDRKNGAALYGCWVAAVIIAGRCDVRGTLLRATGEPHNSHTLSRISRLPARHFDEMLEVCKSIGWLELVDVAGRCDDVAGRCDQPNPNPNHNPMNNPNPTNSPEPQAAAELVIEYPTNGGIKKWGVTQAQIDQWREDFPAVDVLAECRAARAWCEANPTKRKTARGMPKFLVSWLTKHQDTYHASNGKPLRKVHPGIPVTDGSDKP